MAERQQPTPFDAIYALAEKGLGHEDIYVALKKENLWAPHLNETWKRVIHIIVLKKLQPGRSWEAKVA